MELIFHMKGCAGFRQVNTTGLTEKTIKALQGATKNACIFNTTIGLLMLICGLPGSVFCSLIAFQNSSKRSSVMILLIANSVSSMLVLILAVPILIARCYVVNMSFPDMFCGSYHWILATANCVNVWSLILLLTSRFLAVALPHTFFNRSIGRRGFLRVLLVLVITSAAYCIRFFFATWDSACTLRIERRNVMLLYISLEFIVPVIIILFLSVAMLLLVKSGRSKILSTSMYKQSVLFMQLTTLNSGWIFMSTLPSIIHFAISISEMYSENDRANQWPTTRIFTVEMIVLDSFYLRHALDIFIYVACSSRFRAQLLAYCNMHQLCLLRFERVRPLINMYVNTGTYHTDESTRSNHLALDVSRSQMFHYKTRKFSTTDDSSNDLSS